MTITCKLGDIRTNAAIWALISREPGDAVCTLLEPESLTNAYRLDDYYNKQYSFPNDNAVLAQYERDHLYYKARVLEYDFRIIVPVLNGYFRIACERKDERKEQLFPANLLHFYSDGSIAPNVLSRGELYEMAAYFLAENGTEHPDEIECTIEVSEAPAPVIWCKLRDLEDVLRRALADVYTNREMIELEFISQPDDHFYQYVYDYEVQIPALRLHFLYGLEANDKASAYDSGFRFLDDCLLVYDETDGKGWGRSCDTIPQYVDWYCKQHPRRSQDGMQLDVPDELDCRIELPYRMCRYEVYPCPLEL